jgi:hypothetical protein
MRRTSLLFFFAAAIAFAQPAAHIVMSGSGNLKSGVWIRYKSVLSSTGSLPKGFGEGGASFQDNTIHRLMTDRTTSTYFGYDMTVTPDGSGGFLVTLQSPTNFKALLTRFQDGDKLSLLPPPKFPPPQSVRDGDTIAFDLMVSPDGTQRLTDYIEVHGHEVEPPAAKTVADPSDFTLDDGPLSFDFSWMTVWKGGQKVTRYSTRPKPGSTFWIVFPGQGRYILSLTPHEGFTKGGAVRDNVISFQDWEIRFMNPIAGAGRAWNLYVRRDPAYQTNQVSLGTDRLDNLLR